MWSSKEVFYVSDSTGILASNLGRALLCQFPEINFHEEHFPFVRTVEQAQKTLKYILGHSAGRRPLLFSSIMTPEVLEIFDHPEVELFDVYRFFLDRLETCLEAKALRVPGFSRHIDNETYSRRVEAIHFCLEHDDGVKTDDFDNADVILLGVSRAGKTPVSVYLATQMGLKSANFPLTPEYLDNYKLPKNVVNNLQHAVGLTTKPEFLRTVREKRYPHSNYAKLATCMTELEQAESLLNKYKVPTISTAGKSIEEIAIQVCQELGYSRKTGALNTRLP